MGLAAPGQLSGACSQLGLSSALPAGAVGDLFQTLLLPAARLRDVLLLACATAAAPFNRATSPKTLLEGAFAAITLWLAVSPWD